MPFKRDRNYFDTYLFYSLQNNNNLNLYHNKTDMDQANKLLSTIQLNSQIYNRLQIYSSK